MTSKPKGKQSNDQVLLGYDVDRVMKHPEEVLQITTREILEFMDVDRVSVWRITQPMGEMRLAQAVEAKNDVALSGDLLKIDKNPFFFRAIWEGKPFLTRDVRYDPIFSELVVDYWLPHNIHSALVIPLLSDNGAGAAVCFERVTPWDWSEEDINKGVACAQRVSFPFWTGDLIRSKQLLASTLEIQSFLAQEIDLRYGLKQITEIACKHIHAPAGSVYLRERGRGGFRCVVSYQTQNDWMGQYLPVRERASLLAVQEGRPLMIDDYSSWAENEELFPGENIASLACLPILWQGDTVGVAMFIRQENDVPFGQDDVMPLQTMLSQAAAAVELYYTEENSDQAMSLQEALKEIGEVIDAASGLPDLLNSCLEIGCRSLDASFGAAILNDQVAVHKMSPQSGRAVMELIRDSGIDLSAPYGVVDWQHPPAGTDTIAGQIIQFGVSSSVMTLFRIGQNENGCLMFAHPEPHTWTDEEKNFVEIASEMVIASVERMEADQAMQDQQQLLGYLESISRKLNSVHGYNSTLSVIGEGVMTLARTYRAAILMKQTDGLLSVPWSSGVTRAYQKGLTETVPDQVEKLFAINSPILIVGRAEEEPEKTILRLLHGEQYRRIGLWPMWYDDQVVAIAVCFYDDGQQLKPLESEVMEIFLRQATSALEGAGLYETLESQYLRTALTLAQAVDNAEEEPSERNRTMAEMARETARQMGLSDKDIDAIYWAALLHDIGKAGVSKNILSKQGPLDHQEWDVIRGVPKISEQYLDGIGSLRNAAPVVRHFRERFDGNGYPDRLQGEQIPLGARILAVADAYKAMRESRPYREARTHEDAIRELQQEAGKQFDPQVVKMFVSADHFKQGGRSSN